VNTTNCEYCKSSELSYDEHGDIFCLECGWTRSKSPSVTWFPEIDEFKFKRFLDEVKSRESSYIKIHRLRHKEAYRKDIRQLRKLLSFPEEGYKRPEAKRIIFPLADAYMKSIELKRGFYKYKYDAIKWIAISGEIKRFAERHYLSKRPKLPMPFGIAFAEIVYKVHKKPVFVLKGHYLEDNPPNILQDDLKTPVTQGIKRVLTRCLKRGGDENERKIRIYNYIIRVFKKEPGWWRWEIRTTR